MPALHDKVETNHVSGESLAWVPFTPLTDEAELKYFRVDPVRGEILVSMRFPPGLRMPPHHHTGIVIAHTVSSIRTETSPGARTGRPRSSATRATVRSTGWSGAT